MAVEAAECRETAEAEWPLRTEVADVEAPDSLLVSLWLRGTLVTYSLNACLSNKNRRIGLRNKGIKGSSF